MYKYMKRILIQERLSSLGST